MIGKLTGIPEQIDASTLILDVHGVGYLVSIPIGTDLTPAQGTSTVTLYIQTVVREDAIELYGFASPQQKLLFERVTKVSGIGPKIGLAILGRFPVEELITAIESENLPLLTTISGVGKKTAQRLILELRGKFNDIQLSQTTSTIPKLTPILEDLRSALTNLGYTEREVSAALQELDPPAQNPPPLDTLVRQALQLLRTGNL